MYKMSATSKKFHYEVPARASSSRAIRNVVLPSNGSSFPASSTIVLDIGSGQNNTYLDWTSSYLKLKLTNNDATANSINGSGWLSAVKKITIELGSQVVYSCDNYGALYSAMMTLDSSKQFKENAGATLFGSGGDFAGASIASTASRTVCVPLLLTPFLGANKYFPMFSREGLRVRIELNSAAAGYITATTGVADSEMVVSDVEFVTYSIEVGSEVQAQIMAASGGAIRLACPSYQSFQTSMTTSTSTITANLGFSVSSLNRLLIIQQQSAVTDTDNTIDARQKNDLSEFFVQIGNQKYPQRNIKIDAEGSEALAEALVSERALTTFGHQSSINEIGGWNKDDGSGADKANTGSFVCEIDLESQFSATGGLVSGVNTIGSNIALTMNYSAVISTAQTLTVYAEHSILVSLDLATNTFSIAV
tara:strand:+ start:146 stop:1408 length:1263 start_codon:yes stop_codon:yes gene_type:complete